MRVSLVVAAIVMALVAGGAARQKPSPTPPALVGTWGGDRIRVDGAATGAGIQVDCLVARSDEAIVLDKAGTFTVAMTFVPLRGVAIDGAEDRPVSQVTGRLEKDLLHLTIGPAGSEAAGAFTLHKNQKATLPNCKVRS